jgi:hypothetical protein
MGIDHRIEEEEKFAYILTFIHYKITLLQYSHINIYILCDVKLHIKFTYMPW